MSYLVFACAGVPETPLEAMQVYEDAVYETETDAGVKVNTVLRWEQDINYKIDIKDGVNGFSMTVLKHRIKLVEQLIPVNFVPVKDDSVDPNMVIMVFNQELFFDDGLGLVACVSGFGADETGKIVGAYVALPGKDLDIAYDCLSHELMHAIGFAGHTKRVPSTLAMSINDRNFQVLPTNWDSIFIEALYSPELTAGMSREEAAPIIQKFIEYNFPTPPPQ